MECLLEKRIKDIAAIGRDNGARQSDFVITAKLTLAVPRLEERPVEVFIGNGHAFGIRE
jgi:hypothetical protein